MGSALIRAGRRTYGRTDGRTDEQPDKVSVEKSAFVTI